jgi:hypothetical protein
MQTAGRRFTAQQRFYAMSTGLASKHAYTEKLLALAALLRKRASATTDQYQGDKMRRTAEGLEKAGARAITASAR